MAAIVGASVGGLVAVAILSLLTLAIACLRVRTRRIEATHKACTLHSVPTSHNEAYGAIKGQQETVTLHRVADSSGAEPNPLQSTPTVAPPQTTPTVAPSHGYLMKINEAYESPGALVANDNHNMFISQNEAYACPTAPNEAYGLHSNPTGQSGPTRGHRELLDATAGGDGGPAAHQSVCDEPPHTYDYVLR